mmetsp:Transcript_139262/g.277675  ORF Transcript_139262/g.277675 Transcript_139262/m.277675 type:complete len:587 (-) Transcript_139262:227-1987(-)
MGQFAWRPSLAVLLLLCLLCGASPQPKWYQLQAPVLLCPTSPPSSIGVNLEEPAVSERHTPHLLTFYRTSNNTVTLTFEVTDRNKQVVVEKMTVSLQKLTGRRLNEFDVIGGAPTAGHWNKSSSVTARQGKGNVDEEVEWEPEWLWDEDDSEDVDAEERRLSSRRRGGSSSTGRTTSGSNPASKSSTASSSGLRRTNPASARRRGSTASQNQPQQGLNGQRYENKNGQSWGYTSQSKLNNNFGGKPPQQTSYGYSGAGAYSASSSGRTNLLLAGGAGLVGGMLISGAVASTYSSYSRYSYSSDRCWHNPTQQSLSCGDCYRRYADTDCERQGPQSYANRDDIMRTGFWPDDWTWPLTVTIYAISGPDFANPPLCPPPNWNPNTSSISVPNGSGLYLTLTFVSELGDKLEGDGEEGLSFSAILSGIASTLCCCFCAAGIMMFILKKRQQQPAHTSYGGTPAYAQPQSSYGQQPAYAQSYMPQAAYGQPAAYQQPVYAQPAYAQPVGQPPQIVGQPSPPIQGQVVMGTAVTMATAVPTGQAMTETNPNMTGSGYQPGQPASGYQPGQPAGGYQPGQPASGYQPGQPAF